MHQAVCTHAREDLLNNVPCSPRTRAPAQDRTNKAIVATGNKVQAVAFTPDGLHAVIGGRDRGICVYSLEKVGGRAMQRVPGPVCMSVYTYMIYLCRSYAVWAGDAVLSGSLVGTMNVVRCISTAQCMWCANMPAVLT